MEGVAGIRRPPPTALSGERVKARSLLLPSGGKTPPSVGRPKGGEVPPASPPAFFRLTEWQGRLA